jgi:lipoprotein-releasing system permease protein
VCSSDLVLVAAFNIVSTLVMAVTDKQADIAILRTLGARPGSIMKIFIVQGAFIGVFGTLLGLVSGVLLALNLETVVPVIERIAGMDLFPADVYYISKLPSKLVWSDVAIITGVALAISLLATLYPSWRASRIQPAEALRYE